jgi:hypothetical protein
MNKIEEILKTKYWKSPLTDNELEVAFKFNMFDKDLIILMMKEFGKLAFEAGRSYHLHNRYEFETYEDFLKEIENEY